MSRFVTHCKKHRFEISSLLPEPMDMEERDPQLLPHQQCVQDFRVYLIYWLKSPGLLSSVINSGCLSLNEEEILCKVEVRCQMWKLMDILAYREDRMLFDVFLILIREMGFSSVYDAMYKLFMKMVNCKYSQNKSLLNWFQCCWPSKNVTKGYVIFTQKVYSIQKWLKVISAATKRWVQSYI